MIETQCKFKKENNENNNFCNCELDQGNVIMRFLCEADKCYVKIGWAE